MPTQRLSTYVLSVPAVPEPPRIPSRNPTQALFFARLPRKVLPTLPRNEVNPSPAAPKSPDLALSLQQLQSTLADAQGLLQQIRRAIEG